MADTPDLGSGGRPCKFESCYPHEDMVFWMEKWMEMVENRMKSGFLKIGRSLETLIFCRGNAGEQNEEADLTATVTATGDDGLG